jgi:hypothetical protein
MKQCLLVLVLATAGLALSSGDILAKGRGSGGHSGVRSGHAGARMARPGTKSAFKRPTYHPGRPGYTKRPQTQPKRPHRPQPAGYAGWRSPYHYPPLSHHRWGHGYRHPWGHRYWGYSCPICGWDAADWCDDDDFWDDEDD